MCSPFTNCLRLKSACFDLLYCGINPTVIKLSAGAHATPCLPPPTASGTPAGAPPPKPVDM